MKSSLITLAAGALCLPATYDLNRGSKTLAPSIAAVVIVSVLGALIAIWHVRRNNAHTTWWALALAFGAGAFLSEAVFFANYYYDYGDKDQKLGAGVVLALIEGAAIALLGVFCVAVTWLATRRITNPSTGPAKAGR